jgi:hypothetical protein
MEKFLLVLVITAGILAFVQPVSAWAAPNHYQIAEEVYYSLPVDAQSKLDLPEILNGADDPDFKFFDFEYHHYPASQEKANYWLEKGKEYYAEGDYKQASYCFGVATHYISDGVCPPHSGGGHSGYEHTKCELDALLLKPHLTSQNSDIGSEQAESTQMSENAWEEWIKTGDNSYVQQCLDKAVDLSYLEVKSSIYQ